MIEQPENVARRGPRPRTWTRDRVAWFCYLIGQGHTAKAIAADPLIQISPTNVYRQAHRLGISLAEAPSTEIRIRLPIATRAAIDRRAADAGLQTAFYIRRLIVEIASA